MVSRGRPAVPRVLPAAGCAGTGRELARFGDLTELDAVLVGPIGTGAHPMDCRAVELRATPGGLVHGRAPEEPVGQVVAEHLPWLRARGVRVLCAVRGTTSGETGGIVTRLRGSLDFDCVLGVEVDLTAPGVPGRSTGTEDGTVPTHSADPQACLKLMSRVREVLPRGLLLTAKIGMECPDQVAAARSAIAGGAMAIVLSGAVPAHPPGSLLTGPAVTAVTLGAVHRLRAAMAHGRVPEVPVVACGGVHDRESIRAVLTAGASAVQVGTAVLADPGVLWRLHRDSVGATEEMSR